MKFGFTKFEYVSENNKILGYFTYIERDKDDFKVDRDSYYDVIEEATDKKTEVFFDYNYKEKKGYYDYPIDDDTSYKMKLNNLYEFQKKTVLDKIIRYDKKLKYLDASIGKIIREYKKTIVISGATKSNFSVDEKTLTFNDRFLLKLSKNIGNFLHSTFRDSILTELQILNYVADEEKFKISSETQRFILNFFQNILDKGLRIKRYQYIVEKFNKMIKNKNSEKEWQDFIYENYRFIFPEYLVIEKELELETIDKDKKYVDFLLKNQTSELLLEIKLPTQQIMSSSKDRNNYFFVAAVNKAIFQIQRYYKTYKHKLHNSRIDKNVKAILLIGWKKESEAESDKINNDFELARNMYKNIEIITYSELLNKIVNLYELIKNQK